jgi:hypothetical protein
MSPYFLIKLVRNPAPKAYEEYSDKNANLPRSVGPARNFL